MSGATSKELAGEFFTLALSTPCIKFAIDPETGESGEMQFHHEAARRIERALAAVRDPIACALPGVVAGVRGAPQLVPYDANLPSVYDFSRAEFLASGNRPCCLEFMVPAPECGSLRLCFRSLPESEVIRDLTQVLEAFFAKLDWPE